MSKLKVNEIEPFNSSGLSIGGPTANASSILDLQSTGLGFLTPRMTTAQRNAIVSPAEGLLIYNLDDGRLEQYSSGQWTVAGNGLSPVMNVLRVVKNTVLNDGDFHTLEAALASISSNSPTNQYSIEIGPGVFIENPIHMKPYVYVKGQNFDSTIIQANDPTEHLIFGCDFSSISDCILTGVTLSGKALIYHASATGTFQTTFWANRIRFGSADTLAIADGTVSHSNLFVVDSRFGATYSFNSGFIARSQSTTLGRVVIRNCTSSKMTAPYPTDMFVVDGAGCELHLNSTIARTGSVGGGGNGIRIRNGGFLKVLAADINGFSKGMWVENVGSNPTVLATDIIFVENTVDVEINHPGIIGGMSVGADDNSKVNITVATPNFGFVILGVGNGDVVVSGTFEQQQPDGRFTDLTTLTSNVSPMGILVSGDINPPVNGTTVTVESGLGYLHKSDGSLVKIIWPDTPVTLPINTTSYLYFDENSILQHNTVSPDPMQNIIIGRVVTNSVDIVLTEESGLQAVHAASAIGHALRKGLGPVYSTGSSVSENGTRNLTVTPGSYYYGELNFLANGGNPITFDTFYQNGTGGYTIVENETQVDNTKWDNGTGTLAALTGSYYAKHSLYALGDSTNDFDSEAYFVVYSQAQYSALILAEQAGLPLPPPYLNEAVTLIASIIVQEGAANIIEIRDERPIVGFKASGVAASTFHSGLLGLTAGDDHPQYWRNDGTHVATGDFNMGSKNITNLGTANGVTIENHKARHQPGGADALPTAAATTLSPDQANAEGGGSDLARATHIHNVPTDVAVGINTSSTNTQGSGTKFARNNHTHAVSLVNSEVSDTSITTTTSATDILLDTMTTTPAAGTYLVMFSCETINSGNGAQRNAFSIYSGGVQLAHSERFVGFAGGSYASVATQGVVTVNGSQAVEIKWRVAGGTGTAVHKAMNLIKLNN